MENSPIETTPQVSVPTSSPTPIATPTPIVVATPSPTPVMAEGGSTSGSFVNSLNWMEIGFSILGVAALTYVVYYYRFKLKQDKMINNELQRQIDELKMNLQSSMKEKYKSI
jgi:hypothetical protein